eukprot:CAMPEP_0180188630 /NCGR_PEP_ID=MMETSP0986-20121125/44197_1 /TAXON_ID=697907 /ORGANISM="non described non described, Strain CCMP2293" /LENGTH=72 /DNA_ID=CAMNT_0022142869 /DNA_START=455 /DNA_END=673 /DNA_ORIENTATION=-
MANRKSEICHTTAIAEATRSSFDLDASQPLRISHLSRDGPPETPRACVAVELVENLRRCWGCREGYDQEKRK